MKKTKLFTALTLSALLFASCSETNNNTKSIAVFVPGILADSPIYQMLTDGVTGAVSEYNNEHSEAEKATVKVIEAGTNQAEWSGKMTALASGKKYGLIISSNPSLPELVEPLTQQFPSQKFILLDAQKAGNRNIMTICYNQHEQSYLSGYIAGLMSKTHKLGLIAAQEYPIMNTVILPGFKEGAKAANAECSVDFRIVGNWYDATKGAELANALYQTGADVILPICGGASQGVISAAKENGQYISWFDNNGFSKAPGTVISSVTLEQTAMAKQVTLDYLNGKTEWGTARTAGLSDGFIGFVQDDPAYINTVPADIREKMADLISRIKSGDLKLLQE